MDGHPPSHYNIRKMPQTCNHKESQAMLCGIVAADRDFLLGFNAPPKYSLPWSAMARDMEFFRKTTAGRPLVMGRKTALGIGRLLPGRLSLVLSRKPFLELGGVRLGRPGQPGWGHNPRSPVPKTAGFVLQGWDELLEFLLQVWAPVWAAYAPPAYVIGGAQILEESVQRGRLKELFFTFVDASLTSSQDGEPVYLPGNLRAWIQHKLQTEKPLVEIEKDQNNQYPARIYHFCGIPALCKKEISYEMVSIPPE